MRAFFLACALLLATIAPAQAHKPSDSYLSVDVQGKQVNGQWDIALRDLDYAIGLDVNGDGQLSWDEVRANHAAIAAYALARLDLAVAAGPCPISADLQQLDHHTDGAYTVLRFHATCPQPVDKLVIGYRLFADIDPQHKGLLKLTNGAATATAIFSPDQARQSIAVGGADRLRQFGDYLRNGVWHIWIGFDHILFLLSLLLPAVLLTKADGAQATIKSAFVDVLKVVTAFTVAHSLTLTAASLHLLALPSRWVESAIALSVVLAALNNLVPLFRGRRALVAFAFGLIHGFGFASVLADLGLPQGALLLSLVGFNAGVELGQLAIVAGFLPLAWLLRRSWAYRQMLTGGSALIAMVAAVWLVERAFDLKLITT